MARVQLALNVTDLDEAIDFYSKLFATSPAKVRPGYANFAIADPPLKLVLMEHPETRGSGVVGALNHLGVEVMSPGRGGRGQRASVGRRVGHGRPGADDVLFRGAGQGVGRGPRWRPVGGLHGAGRRARRVGHRRGRDLLRRRGPAGRELRDNRFVLLLTRTSHHDPMGARS